MVSLHLEGRAASPGFASGPIVMMTAERCTRNPLGSSTEEAAALTTAVTRALAELRDLQKTLTDDAAEMVGFQIAMLEDPALAEPAYAAINDGAAAHTAWQKTLDDEIEGYRVSTDEYFKARTADLSDMRDRVLARLVGRGPSSIPPGAILIGEDLAPSTFLATDWREGGIVLSEGSPTSHVAMLARARGVPMVVGVPLSAAIAPGASALVDGAKGRVIISPGPEERMAFETARKRASDAADVAKRYALQSARTRNGQRIQVLLNIADPSELEALDPQICDGIGLVRTELLFEGRELPDEDAQVDVYRRIAEWAAPRPVTIRTLDAGGDKPIPGLTPVGELNPFLGVRGVRLTLRHPALFKVQLRALARAAASGAIEIMIPMIATPLELRRCRELLAEACAELEAERVAYRCPALGIMVEVPAVAIMPERFDADFFSIGSNDLVQYTLATGRDVAALADLASAADPSVLRLVEAVVAHGRRCGRKVSLCGDAGGDPALIPALLGTGLTHLSMSPSLVGRAKSVIANSTSPNLGPQRGWASWLTGRGDEQRLGRT